MISGAQRRFLFDFDTELRYRSTAWSAKLRDLRFDRISYLSRLLESFFPCAGEFCRIGKIPMHSRRNAGKNGALLGAAFVANGYDVIEPLARLDDIRYAARFFPADVDADLSHGFYGEWVQRAGLESCALRFEKVAAHLIQ